jgi:hypothetical protein
VDPYEGTIDEDKPLISSLNNGVYKVANATTNTFELNTLAGSPVDLSGYNLYGEGGEVHERVTTLSNLDHLEGKTVQVKIDGAIHPDRVVTSGAVSLDTPTGEAVVGLPYTTTLKTLSHEYDIGQGSMQGQRSRWVRPQLLVYKSAVPRVNGAYLPSRRTADNLNQKVELTTGYLEYNNLKWDSSAALTITTNEQLPLQISAITGTIEGGVK